MRAEGSARRGAAGKPLPSATALAGSPAAPGRDPPPAAAAAAGGCAAAAPSGRAAPPAPSSAPCAARAVLGQPAVPRGGGRPAGRRWPRRQPGPAPSCEAAGLPAAPAALSRTMREGDAGQHPRRGQVEPGRLLRLLPCVILVCSAEIAALSDFAAEYKTKSACENQELKLHCQESKFLIIYSATYGRLAHEENICSTEMERVPPFDCLSYTALEVLSKRCYGKQRCKIIVTSQDFGSPCLPGVKKYLNVSYACVPKFILTAVDPLVTDSKPSVKQNEVVTDSDFDPRESRLPKKEGIIVSNSLATFAYIRDHPERAALLFVSSVCVGLIFTLCALVIRVSCSNDFQKLHGKKDHLVPESDGAYENSENEEEEEEEDSSDSDFLDEIAGLYRPSYSGYNSTEAADLAERIERREQIIQEIWMNSGLDMTPPRNMNTFYINEQ
ncbi:protein eva-1 homolog C isoform X2 [Dromaius novaehollandiae]|uniref:protein eva-1 homolog C isoform X2 n=1 Tax=Dromaius novaehollandiae TaxID=8790 RepID=UPI00311F3583